MSGLCLPWWAWAHRHRTGLASKGSEVCSGALPVPAGHMSSSPSAPLRVRLASRVGLCHTLANLGKVVNLSTTFSCRVDIPLNRPKNLHSTTQIHVAVKLLKTERHKKVETAKPGTKILTIVINYQLPQQKKKCQQIPWKKVPLRKVDIGYPYLWSTRKRKDFNYKYSNWK